MTGDCAIVAKVTSSQYVTGSTKAGLMIRDNLSATVSQRAWIAIVPTATNQVQCRQKGWTENWGGTGRQVRADNLPPGMPYWLKVERRGNMITSYSSQDGTSWSPILSSYYGNLPSTVYIGLFIVSGSATTTTTATFANVAFTGGSGGLVTAPAAPAAVFADGSSRAITVRWLPSFGATSYLVLRSPDNSSWSTIASGLSASTTSYVDTSAGSGTYYYAVRAVNSAGNGTSASVPAALLPAPMVNLAFGGTVTDSARKAGQEGICAFDGNPGSKWFNNDAGTTGWIQYDFGASNAQVVKRYTINSADDVPGRDPKSWNFRGSQDGSSWTWLASASNQTFANRWQQNTYNIGNTTAYRYYRLEITANNGDSSGLQLSELGLWGDSGRTIPDGTYHVVSRYSNKVMDIAAPYTTNGTHIIQWGYNGFTGQKWTFTHLGNGQYKVANLASGRVLDVSGASTADGAQIDIWDWANVNQEKWNVIPTDDGYFKLVAVHSGKVADVEGPSTADGANVHQWSYVGALNQQWSFTLAP
jgi:hypothetical protein